MNTQRIRPVAISSAIAVMLALLVTSPAMATPVVAAVPAPTPETAVVTVATGGDRIAADGSVGPLAGVALGLFDDAAAATPVLECTSDGDGDCSFIVDAASGLLGTQPFVKQVAAPAGWFMNTSLRTGPGSGSGSIDQPYAFQTPTLVAGSTYSSRSDFMFGTSNSSLTRSNGVWQQSRENPPLPRQCGLDVALVLDLSSSVGGNLPTLKSATDELVDAFVGTPSRMAVFGFSALSPSVDRVTGEVYENRPELRSVSTQVGADTFKSLYADWDLGNGTNWDQALTRVATADASYDAAIVLTDGNPTRWGTEVLHGDGSNTHFTDVEEAIFSSNLLKSEGTRVVSFGIGNGVSGLTALNLASISGSTAFDGSNVIEADYFQIPEFSGAGDTLRQFALSSCSGSVSLVKQLVPEQNTGENVAGSVPAGAGWQFDGAGANGATLEPASATTSDDGTGAVSFEVGVPIGSSSADVAFTEMQQSGYTLVTQGGANAVCVDLATGASVPVVNDGATGFGLAVALEAAVSCNVYNRPPLQVEVTVEKKWVVDGTVYADGAQPPGLSATLTLSGPNGAEPTGQPFGEPREGYALGDLVGFDEITEITDASCTLYSSRVTAVNGESIDAALPFSGELTTASSTFEVTNTLSCAAPPTGGSSTTLLPATGADAAAPFAAASGLLLFGAFATAFAAFRRRRAG